MEDAKQKKGMLKHMPHSDSLKLLCLVHKRGETIPYKNVRLVRGKSECFRASEYVRYLVHCELCDAHVFLNSGAKIRYLVLSVSSSLVWVL